jgi:putative hydrolase of the HAD superfamily
MAIMNRNERCILFDWGGTLMRELSEFEGPMVDWPHVETLPFVGVTLAALYPDWTLAVATNAAGSGEAEIRGALRRVGLDKWMDKIYCFRVLGLRKPTPEFFQYILNDLNLTPTQVFMVGDDFETDILGANRSGIRAIWFTLNPLAEKNGDMVRTIHDFRSLPDALGFFA